MPESPEQREARLRAEIARMQREQQRQAELARQRQQERAS